MFPELTEFIIGKEQNRQMIGFTHVMGADIRLSNVLACLWKDNFPSTILRIVEGAANELSPKIELKALLDTDLKDNDGHRFPYIAFLLHRKGVVALAIPESDDPLYKEPRLYMTAGIDDELLHEVYKGLNASACDILMPDTEEEV